MLFIIWFINLNFYVILEYKNSKFKDLIDDITINFLFLWNFGNVEDIRKKYSPIVNFHNSHPIKYIYIYILSRVMVLVCNQVCCQILSKN